MFPLFIRRRSHIRAVLTWSMGMPHGSIPQRCDRLGVWNTGASTAPKACHAHAYACSYSGARTVGGGNSKPWPCADRLDVCVLRADDQMTETAL